MADDTPTPPPQGGLLDDPQLQAMLAQLTPQPVQVDTTPVERSWLSRLGEAIGGGKPPGLPMSGADEESAGLRALGNFGVGLMAASRYQPGQTIFSNLAQGFQGAQRSMTGSEELEAQVMGAKQSYQQQQIQNRLEALKTAIPLLQQSRLMNLPNPLVGSGAATTTPTASRPNVGAPWADNQGDFVTKFTPVAQAISDKTGLPLNYVMGQAGMETGWGSSRAAGDNNFFGITDPNTGKLASYASPQDGANAYISLMGSDRYKDVPRTGTPAEIGDRMAVAGYNPNVPKSGSTDSYGARIGNFAAAVGQPQGTPGGAKTAVAPPSAQPAATPPAAPLPAPVKVAGPGAPTGTPVATATPVAATPPPSTTTPPAQPTPQQGSQLPTDTRAGPSPVTLGMSFQDWQKTRPAYDPTVAPVISPPSQALKDALATQQTDAQNLQAARASGNLAVANKASEAFQTSSNAVAQLQQKAATDTGTMQAKAREDWLAGERTLYNDEQTRLQAPVLEAQKGQQALDQAKVAAGYTAQQHQTDAEQKAGSEQLSGMQAQAQKAEAIQPFLRELVPLLQNAPSGAFGQFLQAHQSWLPVLTSLGLDPATTSKTQLISSLTDYLSLDLKPTATGAMRIQEIPMLKGLMPTMAQSTPTQQQALARILNYTQRVKNEYDFAAENFGTVDPKTNQPNYKILYKNIDAPMELDTNGVRVGGGLGPVVPEPPPQVGNPTAGDFDAARRYQKYVATLPSGMPYNTYEKQADGSFQRVLKVKP